MQQTNHLFFLLKNWGRSEGGLIPHLRHYLSGHSCASAPIHLTRPLFFLSPTTKITTTSEQHTQLLFWTFSSSLAQVQVNTMYSRFLPVHLILAEQLRYHPGEQLSPQLWRGRYLGKQKWQAFPLAWLQPARVCNQVWSTSFEALWGWFMLLDSLAITFWLAEHPAINKYLLESCWSICRFCNHSLCIWLEVQFQVQMLGSYLAGQHHYKAFWLLKNSQGRQPKSALASITHLLLHSIYLHLHNFSPQQVPSCPVTATENNMETVLRETAFKAAAQESERHSSIPETVVFLAFDKLSYLLMDRARWSHPLCLHSVSWAFPLDPWWSI